MVDHIQRSLVSQRYIQYIGYNCVEFKPVTRGGSGGFERTPPQRVKVRAYGSIRCGSRLLPEATPSAGPVWRMQATIALS